MMESTYAELGKANKDLQVLKGKTIELTRERCRLNNTREVFLEQLKRIEGELHVVEEKLGTVKSEHSSTGWKVLKLRCKLSYQIVMRCIHYVYTLFAFLFLNFLHVTYVTLSLSASVTKTILESQEKEQSSAHDYPAKVDVMYLPSSSSAHLRSRNSSFKT